MSPATPVTRAAPEKFALAHPLDDFYRQMGLALPPLQQLDGEAVPQPFKRLLVHNNDMTPTLEKFHQCDIHLRLLGRRRKGNEYFREVVLLLDDSERSVEFGAIKIYLSLFTRPARRQILEERRPLGHILQECGVKHSSRPRAFLRLASDRFINEALRLTGAKGLMVGRGAIRNPWLFHQIRQHRRGETIFVPAGHDVLAYVRALYDAVCSPGVRELSQVQKMKKYMNYLGAGVEPTGQFLHRIRRATMKADFFRVCEDFLNHDQPMSLEPIQIESRAMEVSQGPT